jgi:hypothetical protein
VPFIDFSHGNMTSVAHFQDKQKKLLFIHPNITQLTENIIVNVSLLLFRLICMKEEINQYKVVSHFYIA